MTKTGAIERRSGGGGIALCAALLLGPALFSGCAPVSQSNRTPDVRGDAIRPVDKAPPAGTLSDGAPGSQPERFTLRRSDERPVRADTVVRVDPPPRAVILPDTVPPTPSRTVTMAPPPAPSQAPSKPSAPTNLPPDSSGLSGSFLMQEPPQILSRVPAVYPERARQARVGGTVLVRALVGTDGDVRATRISRSIPELDSAAVACVKQWRFKPAMSSGVAVASWTDVPVRFLLQ